MSIWERYLAPGDIRAQQRAIPSQHDRALPTATQSAPMTTVKIAQPLSRPDAATRARRQNGLVLGGAIFTALSILITRRAVAKKVSLIPPTAATLDAAPSRMSAGLDGIQALTFATMNVFSVGMLSVGAACKYFDIADLEDMRDKVRSGLGYDVYGGDAEADKELETWVAEIMSRKDVGLRESVTSKLAELERIEKHKQVAASEKS